jgi:hypothetical protein
MGIVTASNQCPDANYGMENLLWKFISHCLANFVVRFAVMPTGSGKASKVWDRFEVPNDDIALLKLMTLSKKSAQRKKETETS